MSAGDVDDDVRATLAAYMAERRRLAIADANAAARAAGLPLVASTADRGHLLGLVMTMLEHDFPAAHDAACAIVNRAYSR